jgi:hypothetical protein
MSLSIDPFRVVDPESPLGLTFGQKWQDEIGREIESLNQPSKIRGVLNHMAEIVERERR